MWPHSDLPKICCREINGEMGHHLQEIQILVFQEKTLNIIHQKINQKTKRKKEKKPAEYFNFRMLYLKDVIHKYIILLVIPSWETSTCQNMALNYATSLLFLIKYTSKDQQTHTATMKPIPTFHGFKASP